MTTIIIDEKSKKGTDCSGFNQGIGNWQIISEKSRNKSLKPNKDTLLAIKDVIKGNTIKCDSFEDYLEKVV